MTSNSTIRRFARLRLLVVLGMVLGMLAPVAQIAPAYASTVSSAAFTGGAGTIIVSGTLYAKNGGALTLTVNASSDTKCVDVTGAFTGHQTSSTARSSWTFSFTAGAGDGVQTATAAASPNFNQNNGQCTGQSQSPQSASFVLDNTGPLVTAAVAPVPNAAGWNNIDVTISWTATDAGSGFPGPTPFLVQPFTANTPGTTFNQAVPDRLGNVGVGSVTVKVDKAAPTITGSRSPAANTYGWNNTDVTVSFACIDTLSGIKNCSGPTTLSSSAANQSVTGTAVDNADNSTSATVSSVNIDKVAPTLSGAPTTSPNAAGWYNSDVTIHWTASDELSDLAGSAPADSTISSEGTGLTASASVSDKAGNSTNATSSPAVKVDKTAPNTTASAPTNWNNTDVTVALNAADALSGVATTYYMLDGGAQQSGTNVAINDEGVHTLQFWSVDNAGNVEASKSVEVKIDQTPPTINHTQLPAPNGNGWNSSDVTVTFQCTDALSGVATCAGVAGDTASVPVTTEGANQAVVPSPGAVAVDNANNTSTVDPATVSIDKTAPTISAAPDQAANGNGWYKADVSVRFTCADDVSGLAGCPAAQQLGEGANQSASGTATDAAGNTASAGVSGINVDETAPSLSGAAITAPNIHGWYNGDVTIHWSASDALSDLDGPAPADSTITGEGDNLSVSASVSDLAGNSTSTTVSGIKIDRTAPSTLASVPAPLESGWYAGDVLVTLTTGADLSGVDKTYYSVDGGAAQEYTAPFNHTLRGSHTITFWSVDRADNIEDSSSPGHTIALKIDGVPPTITGSRAPAANDFGWNNGLVTVTFNCSDAESGIAGCTGEVPLSDEGASQSVTGQAQDNAGNTADATVSDINIDLTAPTLSGAATTNPNAFGWYKGDVTIHWTGQDGLSGIDPATQPADSVITGEGSNLGAGPANISDKAGNVGSGSVSGIKIDRTSPTISGATVNDDGTPRSANGAGWFNSAVRVRFTCNDALSDVQECAGDAVLSTDGANQSANGTATDEADNSASTAVTGINIDSQAPQSSADLQCTGRNGYCRGNRATVVLTAADQAGLSGVKEIHYKVGNAAWQVASGASTSVDVNLNGSGHTTVYFYSVDNAGNAEGQGGVDIHYDTIAPFVTHTLNPAANAAGWNNADVTVHFDATDDDGGSGVESLSIDSTQVASQASATPTVATLSGSETISTETNGQAVNASADDFAGNTGTDAVTVKLDKTAPTISGAATTSPNGNGWYNGPVTVHFTCADQGAVQSGIATCPADIVLSNGGTNQSATGTAFDRASNSSSATVSGINIDTVAPIVTVSSVANGGVYTLGNLPIGSCSATDGLSGLASSCTFNVTGGTGIGVGTFNFTATATDNAGNSTSVAGSYAVHYRWDGFLQPINDIPHNPGQSLSVFRAGSTIPVKFQLKTYSGAPVQAATLPTWLTPVQGNATTLPLDETAYSDPGDTAYRWDPTAQQYIFNYRTQNSQGGKGWRLFARLDDGQTVYVDVAMR